MSFVLYPEQEKMVVQNRLLLRQGYKRILNQAATGFGKTVVAAFMAESCAAKGNDLWFVVHRRELIRQSVATFKDVGIHHGVIAAGFDPRPSRVQISSVQTLARRHSKIARKPKLIEWDEVHHIAASTWDGIFSALPESAHLGFTATPERLDGQGLDKHFDVMVQGPSVAWLIENGFLSPYRYYAPPGMDVSGIRKVAGDFDKKQLAAAAANPRIVGDAVAHYFQHARGKRAVVFAASIERSKEAVSKFNLAGVPSAHVDGETAPEIRDAIFDDFRRGALLVVSNVDLVGEGFDLPAIECVIMLRPTDSLVMFLQQVGRGLRVAPGKQEAIILDHAGNLARHGLPDQPRCWSLKGKEDRLRQEAELEDKTPPTRTCPNCLRGQFSNRPTCKYCGAAFEIKSRKIEEVDGELAEVTRTTEPVPVDGKREMSEAQLIAFARKKNIKRPELWARNVIIRRQAQMRLGLGG